MSIAPDRVPMEPAGLQIKVRPPHTLEPRITPVGDHFMLAHHGIARCSAEGWELRVAGIDGEGHGIDLQRLRAMPSREVEVTLECAGNPVDPDKPTRIVGNALWRGVPLRDLIGVLPAQGARYVWIEGVDWGEVAGHEIASYVKDIPLAKALDPDVLLAYQMNGEELSPEHGFPLRVIVPGYYGTNSVKWVRSVSLHAERPQGLYTTNLYNLPRDGVSRPVWAIEVNACLLSPAADARLMPGPVSLRGRTWGHEPTVRVEWSVDGGEWRPASLQAREGGFGWQAFEATWQADEPGEHEIAVRATDSAGRQQGDGLRINQIQRIKVQVSSAPPVPVDNGELQ